MVKESATSEVNRESIEPRIPRVSARGRIICISDNDIIPSCTVGSPLGIFPIVVTLKLFITLKSVTNINAINDEGIIFEIFLGVRNIIHNVNNPRHRLL